VATSANLEGCGNRTNARCDVDSVCIEIGDINVLTCIRACDPANPSTCLSAATGCGCLDGAVCTSFVTLASGDGVCAPRRVGRDLRRRSQW
jgi:hypothetical protein